MFLSGVSSDWLVHDSNVNKTGVNETENKRCFFHFFHNCFGLTFCSPHKGVKFFDF
jgi:hypothetical protein